MIEPMPPITITTKARMRTGSPMPTCNGLQGADHCAGKAGQGGSQREHHSVEGTDIDAKRADHLAIAFAGANAHAETGLGDEKIEADGNREAHRDDGQPIELVTPTARAAARCRAGDRECSDKGATSRRPNACLPKR